MSTTTIEQVKDRHYVLTTRNGVNVRSRTLYLRELKHYRPLDNGFNAPLATDVLAKISGAKAVWDQGSWRRPVAPKGAYDSRRRTTIRALVNLDAEELKAAPACGTAMCFAGWVGELTGAHFVIDGDMILDKDYLQTQFMEAVLVPAEQSQEYLELTYGQWTIEEMGSMLRSRLYDRGFSPEQWVAVPIDGYARKTLGIGHHDWRGMFQAGNTLPTLEQIVADYTRWGGYDAPTQAELSEAFA